MNRKLNKAQLRRVDTIRLGLRRVMDVIEVWHELVFREPNKTLVHHPRFKSVIRHKEAAIKHLFAAQKDIEKLKGER